MTDVQERRDLETRRVTVSTLVEICGNVPGTPVFEAESIDVSPRGMHLKTAYLPESGVPVVCRFENDGGEIVVEGVVAWRREGSRGGEFGVQFTALDSRSVDALRELCGGASGQSGDRDPMDEPGARVRLHIDGLGSPMKARVRTGSAGKVQVGSNLEFLKVGRRLEIEDLEQGARRSAQIDGVSVLIDPSTSIPQLVVALRYEGGEDTTPSPVTAQAGAPEPAARALNIPAARVTMTAAPAKQETAPPSSTATTQGAKSETAKSEAAKSEPVEKSDDEPVLRGRVATLAANAEVHAKAAGEKLATASAVAARGAAHWFRLASTKVGDMARKRGTAPRRTTSPPPAGTSEKPKLRAQSGGPAVEGKPRSRLTPRTTVAAGVIAVASIAGAATWLRGPAAPPPGEAADGASLAVSSAGTVPAAAANAPALARDGGGAVTANVPLFGPTPLTTTEPAPLGPPPVAGSEEAQEIAEAKATLSGSEEDEQWADEKPAKSKARPNSGAEEEREPAPKAPEKAKTRPEDVAPWGRGKLNLPTIHRLRLDGPGAALQGAAEPTGFTVVIPGRKVMEAAAGIAKRDERIARVRASNTGAGAQVSFRFKDGTPAYRVRLRRDYIEFLISAPEKKAAKGSSKSR